MVRPEVQLALHPHRAVSDQPPQSAAGYSGGGGGGGGGETCKWKSWVLMTE